MLDLTPHLLNGISLGLMFALIALGFMLVVGVMEVINLAHGSLFALGAYFAVFILGLNLGVGIEARYAAAFVLDGKQSRNAVGFAQTCTQGVKLIVAFDVAL